MKKEHIGSDFDDFLREEHLLEVSEATAAKRVGTQGMRGNHHERTALVEPINEASKEEPPTAEEKELPRGSRKMQRKPLDRES